MRLIDADALMEQIERLKQEEVSEKASRDELNILAGIEYTQDIVEHLPTVGGWVSVKDRLPETEGLHLCWTQFYEAESHYQINHWIDGRWYWHNNMEVRYWMPLPEPPEVTEDGL